VTGAGRGAIVRWLLRRRLPLREELVAFQSHQLRRLIGHAYTHMPHYRELFDRSGLAPSAIRTAADLAALPITSKRDLQAAPSRLVARGLDPGRLVVHRTTGSTGEPTVVRRTRFEEWLLSTFRFRAIRQLGYRLTDRIVRVAVVRVTGTEAVRPPRLAQSLGLLRVQQVHSLLDPAVIIDTLRRLRPDVVTGVAAPLARVARCLEPADRRAVRPRFVVVGGEVVTPLMRRQIQDGFQAPVYEWYGSVEFNLLAWECQTSGDLHTCDDATIVEIVRDGRPVALGERGEVVVTGLHSFAMPLIRYQIGDIATRGPDRCTCGAPFSTIRGIQGRMHDWFILPGGRLIHPFELIWQLQDDLPWIRQYQLVQEREDRITLRVEARGEAPPPEVVAALEARVARPLGPGVTLAIALVPAIEPEPGGKQRISRSLLGSAYDTVDWSRA
jgi:phenylacetate-CoA ligase